VEGKTIVAGAGPTGKKCLEWFSWRGGWAGGVKIVEQSTGIKRKPIERFTRRKTTKKRMIQAHTKVRIKQHEERETACGNVEGEGSSRIGESS